MYLKNRNTQSLHYEALLLLSMLQLDLLSFKLSKHPTRRKRPWNKQCKYCRKSVCECRFLSVIAALVNKLFVRNCYRSIFMLR